MKISFIGSGKVATQMAITLSKAGFDVFQICSKHLENAQLLANKVGAQAVAAIKDLEPADLYVFSVRDDAIASLAGALPAKDALIVHTSGATPMEVFEGVSANYGVFYPLQTFSKTRVADFKEIPMCIEANNEASKKKLIALANKISHKVVEINSAERQTLHLSAVFACNFTNHLYTLSQELLAAKGLNFDLIRPLIKETAEKALVNLPSDVQTGPAMRDDKKTMETHLKLLSEHPQLRDIYVSLSDSIKKTHS